MGRATMWLCNVHLHIGVFRVMIDYMRPITIAHESVVGHHDMQIIEANLAGVSPDRQFPLVTLRHPSPDSTTMSKVSWHY